MICRHCHRKKVNRPRGLCWRCYYRPGVRERYPPIGRWGEYGALGAKPAPWIEVPTDRSN